MEYEYTTSTGSKILYGILAIFLVAFTLFVPISANNGSYNSNPALIIFPIIGIVAAALIIFNLIKRKILITDYSVKYVNVWGTKEIVIKDIRGFRIGEKAIYIYPFDEHSPKLSIKDTLSIGDKKGFVNWLNENFKDLNKEEFEAAKSELLQDTNLGVTQEDREARYNTNKNYVKWYSLGGLALFIVTAYLNINSGILCIVIVLYPLPGILMMIYSRGIIRLFAKKNSAYLSVFIGLLFPAFSLAFKSFVYVNLLSFANLWLTATIIAIVSFCVILYISTKQTNENVTGQVAFVAIFALVYGYGATTSINCDLDQAQPKIYRVKVIDHRVSHGSKSTSYYITIDGWRKGYSSEEIDVASSFYDRVSVGSIVNVNLKPGILNAPWYYLSQ